MNIFICDSSVEQAATCENKLKELAQKHNIHLKTKVFSSGDALLFDVEPILGDIDLIYLDIQMSGISGLQVAEKLRKMGFLGDIVFYTFNDTHAIDGYDVSALHYIVKGRSNDPKFEKVFLRAYQRKQEREQEMLILTCAGESRFIPLHDIFYFEVSLRIVTVYYTKGSFEFYSTIAQMEEQLHNKGFIRIHKSVLVNLRWVHSVDNNSVTLDNGDILPVGKKYYSDNLKNIRGITEATNVKYVDPK